MLARKTHRAESMLGVLGLLPCRHVRAARLLGLKLRPQFVPSPNHTAAVASCIRHLQHQFIPSEVPRELTPSSPADNKTRHTRQFTYLNSVVSQQDLAWTEGENRAKSAALHVKQGGAPRRTSTQPYVIY